MKRQCTIVSLLVGTLAMSGHALTQEAAAVAPADWVAIQQLVNRLSFAVDYCGRGGQEFADLFIEGGYYVIDQGDGMPTTIATRDGLIGLAGGPGCEGNRTPPTSYIRHLSVALVVERTDYGARGKSYAIYPSNQGHRLSDEVEGQLGVYYDEYVKTAEGWRFRSRRHVVNPEPGEIEFE